MSTIIYGPQGCGKTSKAKELAQFFGLNNIIDNWISGDELPEDTLALTNAENIPGALDFFKVKAAMESASASA